MRRVLVPLLLSLVCLGPAVARDRAGADPFCANVPRNASVSATEISADLLQRGLRLKEIRLADQRCYKVTVLDLQGKRQHLLIDPLTGTIIR